jgi:hypothetical protein
VPQKVVCCSVVPAIFIEVVAAVLASLGILSSAAAGSATDVILKLLAERSKRKPTDAGEAETPEQKVRLPEIRRREKGAWWAQKMYGFAAGLSSIAQVVIGGTLTSQFVKESLSTEWISILGLLTLVSTLVQQHYKLGARAAEAAFKRYEYERLVRATENCLADLTEGLPDAKPVSMIRSEVSQRLDDLARPEGATGAGPLFEPRRSGVKSASRATRAALARQERPPAADATERDRGASSG